MKRIIYLSLAAVLVLSFALSASAYAQPKLPFTPDPPENIRPVVFVHGGSGSALQFESNFLRFASNGYPTDWLYAFEYTTGAPPHPETAEERTERLAAFIDQVLEETGASQIDILGHSFGGGVCFYYLESSAERAAKVANYVAIDSMTGKALTDTIDRTPGHVRMLALWDSRDPTRTVDGATNVYLPDQYHVEVAATPESFAIMYEFFTGEQPYTTDILPEPPGQVELAGRAVFFPANIGVGDAVVEIWEVDGATGFRIYEEPEVEYTLSGTGYYDGSWGPFEANGLKYYEFVILREGFRPHHFYFEPFTRSNHFIRLNTSPPGGVGDFLDRSPNHANLVITRDKEFRSDPGIASDILEVNGANVLEAVTPIVGSLVGIFVYDEGADGVSDLTGPTWLHMLPFLTGIDLYMPAAEPPDATISVVLTPRDGDGKTQIVNVPNWASIGHGVSIRFRDYVQHFDSWTEYVPGQAPGQQRK